MKEKKLLYALGWVKDSYIEEMNDPAMGNEGPRHFRGRGWLIAAVIAAMLLLGGCAAVVLLSLEDVAMKEEIVTDEMSGFSMPRTSISLQGFAGSPNFQAAKEWAEFLETYDPDDEILHSLSNEELDQGEKYWSYMCYSSEMARKIDEICEKYGLNKMGEPQHEQPWENVCRMLGVEDFLKEGQDLTVERLGGNIYRSGTFNLESKVTFPGSEEPLFLTIRAVAKTDFDTVYMNIMEIDSYTQWVHTAPGGAKLLLAYNDYHSLILADRDTCFISVSLDNSSFDLENRKDAACLRGEDWLDREKWNAIADMFDFSFQLKPIGDADWQYLETHKIERPPIQPLGYIPDSSFEDRVRWQLEDKPHPERLQYAFMDIDGDGQEELLIGQDDLVCHIYTTDETNVYNRPFFPIMREVPVKMTDYDEPQRTNNPTYIQICEGNKVLYVLEYTDGITIYGIAEPSENFMDFTIGYQVDTLNHTFGRIDGIMLGQETSISEEAFQAALDTLVPIEVEMRPLSEYPLK